MLPLWRLLGLGKTQTKLLNNLTLSFPTIFIETNKPPVARLLLTWHADDDPILYLHRCVSDRHTHTHRYVIYFITS